MFALQNEVRAAMPHLEQFVPDTLKHYCHLRTGCIGAWRQGRLGAYLILRLCGQSSENYAAFLGVPQSQWQHWANADSAVVHPDWRATGLQRATCWKRSLLPPPQHRPSGATVSPTIEVTARNNVQASGFVIRRSREMYGGYDRYLLKSSCKFAQFWCTTISKCVSTTWYE